MTDDLKNRGPKDRARVNINEAWEVDWWCRKWAVTPGQLEAAVKAVGVMTVDVARRLNKLPPT